MCGKAFRQLATLSQHRATHANECRYACELCEKSFNRLSNLIEHRKTHNKQKLHQCHLCNKAFHQKGNLKNHIYTHTNERPYKCDVCHKGFNQMSNLMCHKLTLESWEMVDCVSDGELYWLLFCLGCYESWVVQSWEDDRFLVSMLSIGNCYKDAIFIFVFSNRNYVTSHSEIYCVE